jgi:hypothetical protein
MAQRIESARIIYKARGLHEKRRNRSNLTWMGTHNDEKYEKFSSGTSSFFYEYL